MSSRHARFEQGTRCTAAAFHCERRERVLERDIFRLGTATTDSPLDELLVQDLRWCVGRTY
ncbi:hypothetical protein BJP25_25740 [Actinokineospora bangkokensis]|uniref:Uncharacterized protein n=1 Tax=Actinokineospora bangkokensis TaxID=1193682 RepID=A0A1Q9LHT4_9PSEU|nr:hypothetical protein BJP25_25740 [Actinokineospora bangkokensis]